MLVVDVWVAVAVVGGCRSSWWCFDAFTKSVMASAATKTHRAMMVIMRAMMPFDVLDILL